MARYDTSKVEILVFTFKEGLLSTVAHDLKLRVTRGTIDVDEREAKCELEAASLSLVCPMKDGHENPTAIPRLMYGEVEKNAHREVLDVIRHPTIRFASTKVSESEIVGQLTLHGQTREVRGRRNGNQAEFSIDQRDFGIKPFSAMLGTLKVKPVVTVRATLTGA
ncbi:MAG: YceI family protein [Myxococcota bacterium]